MNFYKIILTITLFVMIANLNSLRGQEEVYNPMGDPEQLNIQFNPYLWLPAISGEIATDRLSEDFNAPAVDILSNLEFAFMFNMDISKGKFFASPTYFYAKLGTDNVLLEDKNGDPAVLASPELMMNIFELLVGMRFDFDKKVYLDPYIGFRYTNYRVYGNVYGVLDTTKLDESKGYFDPVLGLRLHYYPHPRVPITLKSDIGGFGAGSKFSWTASLQGGYTLSPTVDLFAGIMAYGSNFEEENDRGKDVGLNLTMYGLDLGVRIMIPARYKDPSIFKKAK